MRRLSRRERGTPRCRDRLDRRGTEPANLSESKQRSESKAQKSTYGKGQSRRDGCATQMREDGLARSLIGRIACASSSSVTEQSRFRCPDSPVHKKPFVWLRWSDSASSRQSLYRTVRQPSLSEICRGTTRQPRAQYFGMRSRTCS